jgi:hypothetical protein
VIACFAAYAVAFWVAAVDQEDRGTLLGFWRKTLLFLKGGHNRTCPLVEVGE